jgi:tight adherence protein C
MMKLLNFLSDPELLITLLVAIAAFASIITVAMPWLSQDKLNARLKSVANRREELRKASRVELNKKDAGPRLRHRTEGFYKDFVEKLNLRKMLEAPETRMKLAQAGFRGPGPVFTFVFFRMATPFVMFGLVLAYLFLVNDFGQPLGKRFLFAGLGAFLGFYLPNIFISNIAQRRQESIFAAFPDALDLLLICVESGMSIEAGFAKVASEVGSQSVPLAEELGLTTAELSYLQERRMAYENLGDRTGHPGVKAVCTSLIQAERYGTPVGQALRVMARENRLMRMNLAEKKAASLPAKLTVPMIAFFLPVLFVVILGPAAIKLMAM